MNTLEAIDRLIEAVEAGTLTNESPALTMEMSGVVLAALGDDLWATAVDAFDGSLDSAKTLHEVLVPEWDIETFSLNGEVVLKRYRPIDREYGFADMDPARGWRAAILRAHRHQIAAHQQIHKEDI